MKNESLKRFSHNIRLAGFPVGLGLTSVLVGGTLNRVMIVELGFPASLVGLFFALPLLVSPLRVWLGYRSDAYRIWGLRREPYIIIGSLVAGIGVIGATLAAFNAESITAAAILALLLSFIAYGLGKNLSSNTFEAMLSDIFVGDQRPRVITFSKVAMFIGIMLGAFTLGQILDPFSSQRLTTIVISVVALAILLAAAAAIKQEPRTKQVLKASEEAQATSFKDTFINLVWIDPMVRRFFSFVMLVVIGTLAQDVLLEPYGALALGLSVGQTTSLTAIWGAGTILSMMAAGAWLIKRFGYASIVRVGLWLGVFVFVGIIVTGVIKSTTIFMILVFFLGVCTGLSASGMLTAVIEFTTAVRAGLLMGVWGVAYELGHAFGSLVSGVIVDLGRVLTGGNITLTYSFIFALEAILLVIALGIFKKIDITQSAVLKEQPYRG